jgi:hypothetical protein
MGEAHSTGGKEEKCKERDHYEDLHIDGNITKKEL